MGNPNLGIPLHRVPEQVPCDEHVRPVEEDRFHPSLDDDDSMELKDVVSDRLSLSGSMTEFIPRQFPLLSWS